MSPMNNAAGNGFAVGMRIASLGRSMRRDLTRPSGFLSLWMVLWITTFGAACGLSEFPLDPVSTSVIDAGGGLPPPATSPTMDAGASVPPGREGGSGGNAGSGGTSAPGANDAAVRPEAPVAVAETAPPVVGPGVSIGGKTFAKDDVIVFLHIGHSNMAGRTSTPSSLWPKNFETHPQLWAYAKGGMWRQAKEPLSGDYLTQAGAGPGMSILHTALTLAPNRTMVSIGRGHDGSIGGHCRNFRKGALLYDFVMGPAMELKGKVTFGGIFTMLGVNEFRRDAANLTRFHECLAGIASDMRTDLGDPNIPFVLGDWEAGATGAFDPTNDYAITTKAQMRMAIANIPRSVLIPTENLPMTDDHHYNLTGYKQWAERGFDLLVKDKLLPWMTTGP
jgi:hypothetical protein